MKRLKGYAIHTILAASIIAGSSAVSQAAERYNFGVVPQFEARKLAGIWTPILDELTRRTGYEFVMEGSPRIPEFEVAFMNGEFDFAYMNPFHSIMAERSQDYQLVVRDGSRELSGILVVAKDGPIDEVKDLEGETVAFPAPNALGASLMIRSELDSVFGVEIRPVYVSTHSSAYLNVALGEAAAAGGVMSTFNSLNQDVKARLTILHQTEAVAPHPVAAHPRVPQEVRDAVRDAFLEMAETDSGRALLAAIPMREPVVAKKEDYLSLLDMHLEDYVVVNTGY